MLRAFTAMKMRPLLLASLASVALAGCGTANRGVESVHQPVVSRTDYALDVQSDPSGLVPGEADRLNGWLAAMRVGYGDTVAIDDPYGNNGSARGDVAQVAARFGLLLAEQAPVTSGTIAPGTVRVIVSRTKAGVPSCPDYSRMYEPNFDSHTSSNYGCATNANLAAMVANPADLVRGTADEVGENNNAGTRAIGVLRAAQPTGQGGTWLRAESTGGSK